MGVAMEDIGINYYDNIDMTCDNCACNYCTGKCDFYYNVCCGTRENVPTDFDYENVGFECFNDSCSEYT
jgi:hypothetical protein